LNSSNFSERKIFNKGNFVRKTKKDRAKKAAIRKSYQASYLCGQVGLDPHPSEPRQWQDVGHRVSSVLKRGSWGI
jgi:hypothetical protein